MKTAEQWADYMAEHCPHESGYTWRYQCPWCLPEAFASAIRAARADERERCKKIALDEIELWKGKDHARAEVAASIAVEIGALADKDGAE